VSRPAPVRPALRPSLVAAAVAAVALAIGGVVAVDHSRQQAAEARALEETEARATFGAAVSPLHADLQQPAHDARGGLASARLLVAELLTGSDRDTEVVLQDLDARIDGLREAAAALEGAAETTSPTPPTALPSSDAAPVLERVEVSQRLAEELAAELHLRADALDERREQLATMVGALAATSDVDGLPDTDDPDAWAAAWAEESERLGEIRDEVAPLTADPALAPLAAAQLALLGELRTLADDAAAALADGDIDGHNELVAALDEATAATLRDGMQAALATTVTALTAPLETTEDATVGYAQVLDELRRAMPVAVGASAGDPDGDA
jgi:hypothetical protein